MNKPILCIIIPCFNEEDALPSSHQVIFSELRDMINNGLISNSSYICYINDGSTDQTWKLINKFSKSGHCNGINLSRNFGHQSALLAGLFNTPADIYISIDADLQDDVKTMQEMVNLYHQGFDIVYGCRKERDTDTLFKRYTAILFYRLRQRLGCETILNHADYRLLSSRVVKELRKYEETNLYLRGIIPQLGFPSSKVFYSRKKRMEGTSKYPLKKMLALALNGVVNFSNIPLLFILWIGIIGILFSIALTGYAFISWYYNLALPGWTSTVLIILFFCSMQILCTGCIGIYIGKIFQEVKRRPLYIIQEKLTPTE